jgi:hypothetical protein
MPLFEPHSNGSPGEDLTVVQFKADTHDRKIGSRITTQIGATSLKSKKPS